ncbi:unnamed protein product [Pylaiella littoralis]
MDIDDAIFDKVAQDCPDAQVVVVHQFGDYDARKNKKGGKPVVTREVVRDGLVIFRARGVHLCQIPSSPASLRSNLEVRLALRKHTRRELGRPQGSSYDNDDIGKGVLDVLEILATGEQESPEYRARLDVEKTDELVEMVGNLRLESVETIMTGVMLLLVLLAVVGCCRLLSSVVVGATDGKLCKTSVTHSQILPCSQRLNDNNIFPRMFIVCHLSCVIRVLPHAGRKGDRKRKAQGGGD